MQRTFLLRIADNDDVIDKGITTTDAALAQHMT
jgi:hypothetical protein